MFTTFKGHQVGNLKAFIIGVIPMCFKDWGGRDARVYEITSYTRLLPG